MTTATTLSDDILTTLGYTHDDRARQRESILFNIGLVSSRLRRRSIDKELRSGKDDGLISEATTYIVPLFQEQYVDDRTYFNLPASIVDARVNGGIAYMRYCAGSGCGNNLIGKQFTMASPNELSVRNGMEWEKPSPLVPYYFRSRIITNQGTISDRVWLVGVSPMLSCLEVGLYLSVDLSDPMSDPDDPLPIPDDQIYLVKRMVLDMERFALLTPQQRRQNDGRDFKVGQQPFQPPTTMSINAPINIDED